MSALSGSQRALAGWPPPRLFRLLGAVLGGEVLGAVTLWITCFVLTIAGVVPIGGAQQWVWLPWQIDGIWALVGAIGWGYLVCTLIGVFVRQGIQRRGHQQPAAAWLRISIAVSGYGAMAIGHTAAAHVCVAVVGGAVVIRLVAFNLDGSARGWRWALTPRRRVAVAVVALLAALSYCATHSFAADGDGGTFASGTIIAGVGHTDEVDVGLNATRLPAQITGVTLTGSGAAHFRVYSIVLTDNGSPMTVIPRTLRTQPGALPYGGYVLHPTRLPYSVPAGDEVAISALVKLSSCGDVSVNELKLHYTILGIATGETIALQQPLTMSCRGSS
jgi:hypothetical protein